jgi:hypothetical protein
MPGVTLKRRAEQLAEARLESPAWLDGIEVGRMRRQVHDTDAVRLAGGGCEWRHGSVET